MRTGRLMPRTRLMRSWHPPRLKPRRSGRSACGSRPARYTSLSVRCQRPAVWAICEAGLQLLSVCLIHSWFKVFTNDFRRKSVLLVWDMPRNQLVSKVSRGVFYTRLRRQAQTISLHTSVSFHKLTRVACGPGQPRELVNMSGSWWTRLWLDLLQLISGCAYCRCPQEHWSWRRMTWRS